MSSIFHSEEELRIIRYLLNDLPEGESTEFEERYFCEAAVLEQVGVIEEQLIREYLDGTLPSRFLPLFERRYLSNPELHARVEFARLLRRELRVTDAQNARTGTVVRSRSPWYRNLNLAVALALIVVCSLASWLVIENGRLRTRLSRVASPKGEDRVAVGRAGEGRTESSQILSFMLQPGLERTVASAQPRQFILRSGLKEVRISLELPGLSGDPLVSIDVMLVEPQGRRGILIREGLRTVGTTTGRTVLLIARPEELPPGDYLIFVRQNSPAGDNVLESYSFSILRG